MQWLLLKVDPGKDSYLQQYLDPYNATFLTDGLWTFKDHITDSEESGVISLVSLAKALLTDATMEFQEGGTYILTSPVAQDPTTGEWQ